MSITRTSLFFLIFFLMILGSCKTEEFLESKSSAPDLSGTWTISQIKTNYYGQNGILLSEQRTEILKGINDDLKLKGSTFIIYDIQVEYRITKNGNDYFLTYTHYNKKMDYKIIQESSNAISLNIEDLTGEYKISTSLYFIKQ